MMLSFPIASIHLSDECIFYEMSYREIEPVPLSLHLSQTVQSIYPEKIFFTFSSSKFCINSNSSQTMKRKDFTDLLTFLISPQN